MEKLKIVSPQPQENTPGSDSDLKLLKHLSAAAWLEAELRHNLLCIPRRFKEKLLDELKGLFPQIAAAKTAFLSGQSVFLWGGVGSGKTHLAVGLLYELGMVRATEGHPFERYPVFLPAPELFLELKRGFDTGKPEADVLDSYSNAEILLLDDVGAEKVSDWSRQMFYTLIDRRYRNMKQTIITSNLSLDDLSRVMDDRIASRIAGMGVVIHLDGPDYRLKIGAVEALGSV